MKYPKFSIVMPSYNQGDFIERSILSIIDQNYSKTELIVIDGGSTDKTVEILEKYDKYIAFWVSEPDLGQSDALNKGFAKCSGEIYGWLNSDDVYLPGAFEVTLKSLDRNPLHHIIFGDWLSVDKDDIVLDHHNAFDFSLNHFKYEGFHLNAQSMFWRAMVHKSFSGFEINLHRTMDYQMILEFGLKQGQSSFLRVPQTLGAFRRHDGQKTRGFDARVRQEHKAIAKKYGYEDKYDAVGQLKRIAFRFRRAWWYFQRGGLKDLFKRIKPWLWRIGGER